MIKPMPELRIAADKIVTEIRRRMIGRKPTMLVAFDGGSGSGKSTIARLVVNDLSAAMIQSDDFFAAQISTAEWNARSPEARSSDAIDWKRLRAEALEPLLAGRPAQWHAFDFEAGARPDGTYLTRTDWVRREPTDAIVLDGTYSTRPELADLINLAILVDAPTPIRRERLAGREDRHFLESWHARWDAAERYYFTDVRPRCCFDMVIDTAHSETSE